MNKLKESDSTTKHYWTDIESGITFECTKKYRETMLQAWEAAKPKLTTRQFGQVLIFGTGGEIEGDDYKKLFL